MESSEKESNSYCDCGLSEFFPFCDGKEGKLKRKNQTEPYKCKSKTNLFFCSCNQTQIPPFCDGTHKIARI